MHHIDHPPLEPLVRLVGLALLATVLTAAWRRVAAVHRQRLLAKPRAQPQKLQVWEGEGGHNPMTDLPR
jgi:hypothetical protein